MEATPISGPAWVYIPESVSLEIDDPTTLQIPKINAPLSFASLRAAIVSAVSPDWDMGMMTSSFSMMGSLYLNSDAYSTSVGIRVIFSKRYSPTKPACHEVPQPSIIIRFLF